MAGERYPFPAPLGVVSSSSLGDHLRVFLFHVFVVCGVRVKDRGDQSRD